MKQRLWLLGLGVFLLMGMTATFSAALSPTRAAVEPPAVLVTPSSPPPTCMTHTTGMTLTANSLSPPVGDVLTATVTLANEGCGLIGLPQYRLYITQSPYTLAPASPDPVLHTLGLNPGETDVATFTLHTLGVGTATLRAAASFEVHLGYSGPAYWAADSAAPLTVTVPATDTEIVVAQQAAYDLGCFPPIALDDVTYSFGCVAAAGHSFDVQIERFADDDAALATFNAGQGTLPLEPFRCYPAYAWLYEQETMPQWQGWHRWLAERWIITTHSVDDTGIPVAPAPVAVSEAIYRAAVRNTLFPACDRLYLPLVYNDTGG